jgi:hypothetical protein
MNTTPGPWIVSTTNEAILSRPSICVKSVKTNEVIAVTGHEYFGDCAIANAALIAIAPEMLDALIAIQETAQMDIATGENGIHSRPINELISEVFAKLANEAGV